MPVENEVRDSLGSRFGLIETLRWEPGSGAVRASLHLDRMQASAKHFNKIFDRSKAEKLLAAVSGKQALRLRLLLDEGDELGLTSHPYRPLSADAVWTVKIAQTKLSSADLLLAHKTTKRQAYDKARAEFAASEADEVLMENENGFFCEGTITSLFVEKNGLLMTPRLSHGLLRGVLRQQLIETGKAVEGDVKRSDLNSHPFFIGNSLRELIRGRLAK
jgi:4-amino-4-deoxychorismate lyase